MNIVVMGAHPDHQATGALGTQAVVGNRDVALAYYEVFTGVQSVAFQPNRCIDITREAADKKQSVFCHVSQNVGTWWRFHDDMARLRYTDAFGYLENETGRAEGYQLAVSTAEAEALFDRRPMLHPSGSRDVRSAKHA